jgi:hypothetical protein
MNNRLFVGSIACAALALTACGGGGGTIVSPTPGPTCGPVGITSQLVYPAPSSTVSAATTSEIAIAVSSPLPLNTYNLALIASGGTGYTYYPLAQISASQLPAGSAATTIPNPTYEAVNLVSELAGATKFQVAINLPSSNCTPQNVPGGTFSTQ